MIGAIILAAGGSARLGEPKQLLLHQGQSLVRRAATTALQAGCAPIVAVVGRERAEIAAELTDLPIILVPNDNWEDGIGSSIRAGISALSDWEAVVIATCDQPHVDATLIRSLLAAWAETQQPIIASTYSNTFGVPALFTKRFRDELLSLPNDHGAKAIIHRHPAEVATVPFPAGAIDIDTPADYQSLQASP